MSLPTIKTLPIFIDQERIQDALAQTPTIVGNDIVLNGRDGYYLFYPKQYPIQAKGGPQVPRLYDMEYSVFHDVALVVVSETINDITRYSWGHARQYGYVAMYENQYISLISHMNNFGTLESMVKSGNKLPYDLCVIAKEMLRKSSKCPTPTVVDLNVIIAQLKAVRAMSIDFIHENPQHAHNLLIDLNRIGSGELVIAFDDDGVMELVELAIELEHELDEYIDVHLPTHHDLVNSNIIETALRIHNLPF